MYTLDVTGNLQQIVLGETLAPFIVTVTEELEGTKVAAVGVPVQFTLELLTSDSTGKLEYVSSETDSDGIALAELAEAKGRYRVSCAIGAYDPGNPVDRRQRVLFNGTVYDPSSRRNTDRPAASVPGPGAGVPKPPTGDCIVTSMPASKLPVIELIESSVEPVSAASQSQPEPVITSVLVPAPEPTPAPAGKLAPLPPPVTQPDPAPAPVTASEPAPAPVTKPTAKRPYPGDASKVRVPSPKGGLVSLAVPPASEPVKRPAARTVFPKPAPAPAPTVDSTPNPFLRDSVPPPPPMAVTETPKPREAARTTLVSRQIQPELSPLPSVIVAEEPEEEAPASDPAPSLRPTMPIARDRHRTVKAAAIALFALGCAALAGLIVSDLAGSARAHGVNATTQH